jgi:hypothetical protein
MINQQSAISNQQSADEDPSPTEKIYGLIAGLQNRHDQAVADMKQGAASGQTDVMTKAMSVMHRVERLMPKVGSRARKYFLSKVHR